MKIVILDSYAANPGDILWDEWTSLGQLTCYDRTMPEDVIKRAQGAEIILTNKVIISREIMQQLCPTLRYIGVLATGYNVVDIDAAKKLGVVVTNIPAYSTMSVAQMVMAHLLNITHHVAQHAAAVNQGRWQYSLDFCFWDSPLIELNQLTLGIVGLGNTGTATALMAQSMGMQVMAFTSKPTNKLPAGICKAETLEELFSAADVVSLHCPLTPGTHHLVNAERLSLMKPSAILINTGRGPLVDEAALASALNNRKIYAAGIDVLEQEPPRNGSPLIGARNCYITPHIAWATLAARQRLMHIAAQNIQKFIEGTPQNVVS